MVRPVSGQGFAFVPRELVAQPKAFGLAAGLLAPAHGVDESGERYRAAMVQHLMAVAVRGELLRSRGVTPSRYASRFEGRGLGEDRVRRIFRGETMAQLTDIVFWTAQFPGVASAIAEYASGWFVERIATDDSLDVQRAAPVTDAAEIKARQIAALHAQAEAQVRESAASTVRRTPQNAFSSPTRRIR
jgi:hypothetical protein